MNSGLIPVRYFATVNTDDVVIDVEITQGCFEQLVSENATISYDRHTVYDNGVNQICLTVDSLYDVDCLELMK